MSRVYLDYAAATPMDEKVLKSMMPYFSKIYYNPSALYLGSRDAKRALEDARSKTARLIGAKSTEIIFTAGGTESDNLAITGVMNQHKDSELIISAIEHEAVLKSAEQFNTKKARVDRYGRVIVAKLKSQITEKTILISVMLSNNEIGTLQPIKEIVEVVQEIRTARKSAGNKLPLYLHTDACQAPLYLDINVSRIGVDMMTLNGGKIHGPKQSGILYKKANVVLQPLIKGGGQEFGLRSGTENVAFAVGFTKALELAGRGRLLRVKSVVELRDYFAEELVSRFNAEINGHRVLRIANNIHATFPGVDNERVLFSLDDMGVDVAVGSACSASNDTSSHVLLAIGKTDEYARSSIRFSIGIQTTKQHIDIALDKLEQALKA